jgi:polyhydroxybutyrate depolymerase
MGETYLEIRGLPGQNDLVRQYKVHVPPGYDPEVPAPAVFCLHGLGQTAVSFCVTATGMKAKADETGYVLIMPNGYSNSWNGGTCCGDAAAEQLDDVGLIRAIFEEVGEHVNLDLDRIYATGLSNGGYLSVRLACEAADMFAAVAPGAGAVGTQEIGGGFNPGKSDWTECKPSQPVSVLALHGTGDLLIPYSKHELTMKLLAAHYGCKMQPEPAVAPKSGGDTRCVSYPGCPQGIELTGCSVEAGGHCWFGSSDCGTGGGDVGLAIVGNNSDTLRNTDAIWDFFERHKR